MDRSNYDSIRQHGLEGESLMFQGKFQGMNVYSDPYINDDRVIYDGTSRSMIVSFKMLNAMQDDIRFSIQPLNS